MIAYVKALRDYNDAVKDGLLADTPKGREIVSILAKNLNTPEADIRRSFVYYVNPDGKPNIDGLKKDLTFFRTNGDVTNNDVTVDSLLDLSFIENAVKQLGPYQRKE